MKIEAAWIKDPRREGEFRNPYLVVEVDEEIHATSAAERFDAQNGIWSIMRHGPFVAVDHENEEIVIPANLGEFNTTGIYKDKLVEVVVGWREEEMELAMSLDRARRLLRKFNLSWRLILDDVAGQHGKLLWRLVSSAQTCCSCTRLVENEVYYRGTHMPFCDIHLREHNAKIRGMRISKTA